MNARARAIEAAALRMGLPVVVRFDPVRDGLTLPVFVLA